MSKTLVNKPEDKEKIIVAKEFNALPNTSPAAPVMLPPVMTRRPVDCPPGLEYLLEIDQLLVKQNVEIFQLLTGVETRNSYQIQNSLGQNVFYVREFNDYCSLQCGGPNRGFEIYIWDYSQREVIHISRPVRCSNCFFYCCLQFIRVESPPGRLAGYVRQKWNSVRALYDIEDDSGEVILRIRGPIMVCEMCPPNKEFIVLSSQFDVQIASIVKQWSGIVREAYTKADIYSLTFPKDMDVKVKVLLIATAFLIDYMFFEESINRNQNQNRRPGHHRSSSSTSLITHRSAFNSDDD